MGASSFIKGCSLFSTESVSEPFFSFSRLNQFSGNPIVHTRLSCYLPWVAEQYDLTYTQTEKDVRCEEGTGNIDEVGGDLCRTTPTYVFDRLDELEAPCIFLFYLDGIEYNECTLTEIQNFTRPRFVCPLREYWKKRPLIKKKTIS